MGRHVAGNTLIVRLVLMVIPGCSSTICPADKLLKLPVDIKKSTLLFKLRVPGDLLEAANPACPEECAAGEVVSLGMCRSTQISQFVAATVSLRHQVGQCVSRPQCHVGGQYLASSGQTVFSVAQELELRPFDIVKFNEDLNPIYPLQAGSILIVPLPRSEWSSYRFLTGKVTLKWTRARHVPWPVEFLWVHAVNKQE